MNWFLTGLEPELAFYWACDEGSGTVLNDRSGHDRTAKWFGSFPDLRWMVSTIPTRRIPPIVLGFGNMVHLVFPGTPGGNYALEASGDLISWSPVATNTAGVDGLVRFQRTLTRSRQFFRPVAR